jgi:hypothetical protein
VGGLPLAGTGSRTHQSKLRVLPHSVAASVVTVCPTRTPCGIFLLGDTRSGGSRHEDGFGNGFYGQEKLRFNITREDIGAFTAAQVESDRYIGVAPAISS